MRSSQSFLARPSIYQHEQSRSTLSCPSLRPPDDVQVRPSVLPLLPGQLSGLKKVKKRISEGGRHDNFHHWPRDTAFAEAGPDLCFRKKPAHIGRWTWRSSRIPNVWRRRLAPPSFGVWEETKGENCWVESQGRGLIEEASSVPLFQVHSYSKREVQSNSFPKGRCTSPYRSCDRG